MVQQIGPIQCGTCTGIPQMPHTSLPHFCVISYSPAAAHSLPCLLHAIAYSLAAVHFRRPSSRDCPLRWGGGAGPNTLPCDIAYTPGCCICIRWEPIISYLIFLFLSCLQLILALSYPVSLVFLRYTQCATASVLSFLLLQRILVYCYRLQHIIAN